MKQPTLRDTSASVLISRVSLAPPLPATRCDKSATRAYDWLLLAQNKADERKCITNQHTCLMTRSILQRERLLKWAITIIKLVVSAPHNTGEATHTPSTYVAFEPTYWLTGFSWLRFKIVEELRACFSLVIRVAKVRIKRVDLYLFWYICSMKSFMRNDLHFDMFLKLLFSEWMFGVIYHRVVSYFNKIQ